MSISNGVGTCRLVLGVDTCIDLVMLVDLRDEKW